MNFTTFISAAWLVVIFVILVSYIAILEAHGANSPVLVLLAIVTLIVAFFFIWGIF